MAAILCALILLNPATAHHWPGFLGDSSSELSAKTLPLDWSPTRNIAWSADIPGDGQSSPIIWGEQVFATSVTGEMKDEYHVLCWNLSDGELLWEHKLKNSVPVKSSLYVSRAAPTPATDGNQLYVFFESGDVLALSMQGKSLWHRSLTDDYGAFEGNHGLGSSPVLTEQAMVILVDHSGPSYLIALDKSDGTTLWKTDRASRTSWSSPMKTRVRQQEQIVCSSAGSVDGYDAQTGKKLWTLGDLSGNTVASPLAYEEGKVLIGASAGRGEARAAGAAPSNLAMEIRPTENGSYEPHILWRNEKVTSSFGSPMVHGKQAYWVNRSGVVFCLNAETGELLYNQRIPGSCWATPLAVEDRIYFFGKNGETTVLRAGEKQEVLAENQLWSTEADDATEKPNKEADPASAIFGGPVQYGVAAVNGSLIIRTGNKLYCLQE